MQSRLASVVDVGRIAYIDPTGYVEGAAKALTGRLESVAGKVAGLLDNGNDTSSFFFDSLSEALRQDYGVGRVIMQTKFTSTRPADADTINAISAEADFLISGVAL